MIYRYVVMRPEEMNEGGSVIWPQEPSLGDLRLLIEPIVGGDLEHVTVLADFKGGLAFKPADMFVHERGLIVGLPRNANATDIYRRNSLMHQGVSDPESLPWIAGPAVLFEKRVWR